MMLQYIVKTYGVMLLASMIGTLGFGMLFKLKINKDVLVVLCQLVFIF